MPIEKIQSQTTTHHVCGGGLLRLTDNLGLSRAFAGVLGARSSPLRNGGPRGGRVALMRSATALPCPLRSGVARAVLIGPAADATTSFPSRFLAGYPPAKVIHSAKFNFS